MKNLLFLVLLVIYCKLYAATAKGCYKVDVTKIDNSAFFRENVSKRGDLNNIFHEKIRKIKCGKRPKVNKILNYVHDCAQSDYFTDQWEAMFRTLWIASISHDNLNTDNLCFMANILNSTVLIKNSQLKPNEVECILELNVYLIMDAFYQLTSNTLTDRNCTSVELPKINLPACNKISKCVDGGRYYEFENVWKEYEANQKKLEETGQDNNNAPILCPIIRELYVSDDLYENYIAAIFSLNAANRIWLWDAGVMNGPILLSAMVYMNIFEQTLITLEGCSCLDFRHALVKSVNDYHKHLTLVKQAIQSGAHGITVNEHPIGKH